MASRPTVPGKRPSSAAERPSGSTRAAAQTKAAAAVLVAHVAELREEQLEVGAVAAAAGPPGAEDAGCATEHVDGEAGVVGERRQAGHLCGRGAP